MKECAFCMWSGSMTAEHIFAKWIRELFPGEATSFYIGGPAKLNRQYRSKTIDHKANVVCESCNNGWMSTLEVNQGKPVLTPFIIGEFGISITREIARALAVYAFKTAVVANHADRRSKPFFSAQIRHEFRASHTIPRDVFVWVCGIKNHRGQVGIKTNYYTMQLSRSGFAEMYIFTFGIGCLVVLTCPRKSQPVEVGVLS